VCLKTSAGPSNACCWNNEEKPLASRMDDMFTGSCRKLLKLGTSENSICSKAEFFSLCRHRRNAIRLQLDINKWICFQRRPALVLAWKWAMDSDYSRCSDRFPEEIVSSLCTMGMQTNRNAPTCSPVWIWFRCLSHGGQHRDPHILFFGKQQRSEDGLS